MAYETGTATDYSDLAAKLNTFLTTNAALVAAGQEWTNLRADTDEHIWGAPGLSGTEEIYVGVRRYADVPTDVYNWEVAGFTGFVTENDWTAQPGKNTSGKYLPLWNSSIPYWFVANGQRALVLAKIGTTYQFAYLGKYLAYATPGQYSYPLLVAAMNSTSSQRYSASGNSHIVRANGNCGQLYTPSGAWSGIDNGISADAWSRTWPTGFLTNYSSALAKVAAFTGGDVTLLPVILISSTYAAGIMNVYGELDGVFWCPGVGAASESVITIDTVDYLVFQSGGNTTTTDFAAMRLA